jgi:hypothetical protein
MDEMRGGNIHNLMELDPSDPKRIDVNFLSISLPIDDSLLPLGVQ